MKTNTPILSAARAMHAEDDKRDKTHGRDPAALLPNGSWGHDPYNTLSRREADKAAFSAAQAREAGEILACYEQTLTIHE